MTHHKTFGYLRVATAVPRLRVANPVYNSRRICSVMDWANKRGARLLQLPELCISSYTAANLHHQKALLQSSLDGLEFILRKSVDFDGLVVPSLPLMIEDNLYNSPLVLHKGKILGGVPKLYLPGRKEFYDPRWFSPGSVPHPDEIKLLGQTVPFGTDLLFAAEDFEEFVLGLETCHDAFALIPPNRLLILAGAKVIGNGSASSAQVGKAEYRRQLVRSHSANYAAYVYASAGTDESTTDFLCEGHTMIGEYGRILAENERFEKHDVLLVADVDLERMQMERLQDDAFGECQRQFASMLKFRRIPFTLGNLKAPAKLERYIDPHPFTPADNAEMNERCVEISQIQACSLATRLLHLTEDKSQAPRAAGADRFEHEPLLTVPGCRTGKPMEVTIGISYGKDSTWALLKACDAYDRLGWSRKHILGYTMPGFGTPDDVTVGAHKLMNLTGITAREVDIRPLCFAIWLAEGYKPFKIDLQAIVTAVQAEFSRKLQAGEDVSGQLDLNAQALKEFCRLLSELPDDAQDLHFENTQARVRTNILMTAGFNIGTGNLLEAMLAWCTLGGDQTSMYHINIGLPKSPIALLIKWHADRLTADQAELKASLYEVVDAAVSPDLLPTNKEGKRRQLTESSIGPRELNEFYMECFVRWGMHPAKVFFLAKQAPFDKSYTQAEIIHWLKRFYSRGFIQVKRSCMPDGPKLGPVCLSPRGDWRMPSDADVTIWLDALNDLLPDAQ